MEIRSGALASVWALALSACGAGSNGSVGAHDGSDGGPGSGLGGFGPNGGNGGGLGGAGNGGGAANGGASSGGTGNAGAGLCTAASAKDGAFVGVTDITQGSYPDGLAAFCDGSVVAAGQPLDPAVAISLTRRDGSAIALPPTRTWLAHFDTDGFPTWANAIVSGNIDENWYTYISTLGDGSVFVSGVFGTSVVFDGGGPKETKLFARSSSPAAYVARYAADGAFQWAKPLGASNRMAILGATADPAGTAYLAVDTLDVNGAVIGAGEINLNLAEGNGVIVAVDANGNFLRHVKFDEAQNRLMILTMLKDGGLLAQGVVTAGLVLGKGTAKETSPTGTFFFARFNPDSSLDWVRTVTEPKLLVEDTASVGLPDGSAVFGASQRAGAVTLGVGEAHETTVNPLGTNDNALIAHYASDGSLMWATNVGSENSTILPMALATATDGSIWMAGHFFQASESTTPGNLVIAPGTPFSQSTPIPNHNQGNFIIRFGADGKPIWSTFLVSTGFQETTAITATTNTVIAMGGFAGTGTFGSHNVTATLNPDFFLARFGP